MQYSKKIVIMKPCGSYSGNALLKIENTQGRNKCVLSSMYLEPVKDVYYFCVMGNNIKTIDLGRGGKIKEEFYIEDSEDMNFAVIRYTGSEIVPVYAGFTLSDRLTELIDKVFNKFSGAEMNEPEKKENENYKEILKSDFYLHEDTTLSDDTDINLIAKENYFDYKNESESNKSFDYDNLISGEFMDTLKEVIKDSIADIIDSYKSELINDLKESVKDIIGELKELIQAEKAALSGGSKNNDVNSGEGEKAENNKPEDKYFDFNAAHANGVNSGGKSRVFDENSTYYESVKWQLEEMFNQYPRYEIMEKAVDNSKFVKVEYNNSHYLVGILNDPESQEVNFILYAVPGKFSNSTPEELKGYAQWVPLDKNSPNEDGYWLMFQSAKTGENVEII